MLKNIPIVYRDPGPGAYAIVLDRNGPVSRIVRCDDVDAAISEVATMEADLQEGYVDTHLEDSLLDVDVDVSEDYDALVEAARASGWETVACSPEYLWVILYLAQDQSA